MSGAPKVKPKSGGLLPWSVQHVLSSKKTPGIVLLVFVPLVLLSFLPPGGSSFGGSVSI